jgi:hypothetical protein
MMRECTPDAVQEMIDVAEKSARGARTSSIPARAELVEKVLETLRALTPSLLASPLVSVGPAAPPARPVAAPVTAIRPVARPAVRPPPSAEMLALMVAPPGETDEQFGDRMFEIQELRKREQLK